MTDKEWHRDHKVDQGINDGLVQTRNRQLAAFHRAHREIRQTGDSKECGTHLAELDALAEFPHRVVKDSGELRQRRTTAVSGLAQIVGDNQIKILDLYKAWRSKEPMRKANQPPA